jgi:hypothetical protein
VLSGAAGGHTFLVAPGSADSLRSLPWQDDARARLADDVGAGFAAVVIRQPVDIQGRPRLGWWRVDPRTGATIGVMESGYHQALTEEELEDAETQRRAFTRWRIDQDHGRMEAIRSRIARGRPVSDAARGELELYDLVDKMISMLYNLPLL